MQHERGAQYKHLLIALGFMSAVSISFFLIGAWRNHSYDYWYLVWNLLLAWLPLVFAYGLVKTLRKQSWASVQSIVLSVLWLGFLPNSFYMISDFIHLGNSGRGDLLFDAIMFTSFVLSGLILGFTSLYLVHQQLRKRLSGLHTSSIIGLVLLLCSFAIYLGRNLRWNTWDILVNPTGVLFDVSDRIINPKAYPQTFSTTLGFFVLLGSIYFVVWQLVQAIPSTNKISSGRA